MKIVLEDKDRIYLKQIYKLENEKTKSYSSETLCSIVEMEDYQMGTEICSDMKAETLFGKICNTDKSIEKSNIIMHVTELLGFEMFRPEQYDFIDIISSKEGILLNIKGQIFTPEQLKESALKVERGVTTNL
ncbi:MAG: hypothetical protein ACLRFL_01835 [Clostridia bacterium]